MTDLEMGMIGKRKSSESELEEKDEVTPSVFKPGFFVPCHPLLIAGNNKVNRRLARHSPHAEANNAIA